MVGWVVRDDPRHDHRRPLLRLILFRVRWDRYNNRNEHSRPQRSQCRVRSRRCSRPTSTHLPECPTSGASCSSSNRPRFLGRFRTALTLSVVPTALMRSPSRRTSRLAPPVAPPSAAPAPPPPAPVAAAPAPPRPAGPPPEAETFGRGGARRAGRGGSPGTVPERGGRREPSRRRRGGDGIRQGLPDARASRGPARSARLRADRRCGPRRVPARPVSDAGACRRGSPPRCSVSRRRREACSTRFRCYGPSTRARSPTRSSTSPITPSASGSGRRSSPGGSGGRMGPERTAGAPPASLSGRRLRAVPPPVVPRPEDQALAALAGCCLGSVRVLLCEVTRPMPEPATSRPGRTPESLTALYVVTAAQVGTAASRGSISWWGPARRCPPSPPRIRHRNRRSRSRC